MPRSPLALHLAVALNDAGWHPAAWRLPGADPAGLLTAAGWARQVRLAREGEVDFVTIEDAGTLQSAAPDGLDDRTGQVRGRLDASMIAAAVAPVVKDIGLVPVIGTAFSEPLHVSTAVATLDFVSTGNAGWLADAVPRPGERATVGDPWPVEDPLGDAAEHVEVVRRLWDSWEDGAEIRDAARHRFVDRRKIHHIDFEGAHMRIRGPSITPRPPQGQPPVMLHAGSDAEHALAGAAADVVIVTPTGADEIPALVDEARVARAAAQRDPAGTVVLADLVVVLEPTAAEARARLAHLNALDDAPLATGAAVFAGTAAELADLLTTWRRAGADGVRLCPAAVPADLTAVSRGLVPELRPRGARPVAGAATGTLRRRLGLPEAINRYAAAP